MAFTAVLKEIFTIANELSKIMQPEDIKRWAIVATLLGFEGTNEYNLIPENLRKTIDPENKMIIN